MTTEEEIQQDLDNGKYGMICSNEDTFKRYVFPKLDQARKDCKGKLKHLEEFYKNRIEREVYLARQDEHEIMLSRFRLADVERSEMEALALDKARQDERERIREAVEKIESVKYPETDTYISKEKILKILK